ncbi:hypothetical protein FMM05_08035 [Flavobacterium zepuense]|uniref:Uncharacterized protein n=1 Tax=Flavobacterium zepuense TaxID=2593302 RepID=A0A552V445_9FLAO|nr:hypothetical protein [Flavobacterium zepuense]TRW25246.1 hypothetical protein FMM05_08035 [Flavobacterium zepuense]
MAKNFFGLGLAMLFVLLGIHLFTTTANDPSLEYPTLVKGLGIFLIAFFGLGFLAGLKVVFFGPWKKKA